MRRPPSHRVRVVVIVFRVDGMDGCWESAHVILPATVAGSERGVVFGWHGRPVGSAGIPGGWQGRWAAGYRSTMLCVCGAFPGGEVWASGGIPHHCPVRVLARIEVPANLFRQPLTISQQGVGIGNSGERKRAIRPHETSASRFKGNQAAPKQEKSVDDDPSQSRSSVCHTVTARWRIHGRFIVEREIIGRHSR